jgi:act minimal PKS acyl carrier protein
MSICTLGELTELMRETLGGDILDVPLSDLGFDSLAKLELAASLRRRFGVVFPEDVIEVLATPRDALACVNGAIVAAA